MLIKICGLTNAKVANLAALAGANYIGLLFSSVSPRQVNLTLAQEITQAARLGGAEVVGVFVDESLEQIQEIIQQLKLTIIQLHGDKVRNLCSHFTQDMQIIYVVDENPLPSSLNPTKDFLLFENQEIRQLGFRYFIAGGITLDNVQNKVTQFKPYGIDLSRGVESSLAIKDINKIRNLIQIARPTRYGKFGGQYVPELLISPLQELEHAYHQIALSNDFRQEFIHILTNYAGRPTALTEVPKFAQAINGPRIFLKREDLLHTGAHKINNALGQCLLAKKMGKIRIVAETGAGQHGVATATACALFGLKCTIYMGQIDIERQAPNVAKMRLLGANVIAVTSGSATLKDAVNEALRDWAESFITSHYCLGSALGPHPFPTLVANFQAIIGQEAKAQFLQMVGKHPHMVVACVGGGSNAIGIFSAYLNDEEVKLVGVEAGGKGQGLGNNAARFQEGSPGVLHGSYTYLLQTTEGQIVDTHSISAGLDYAAVGPHHANLFTTKRANYAVATDEEALSAFLLLTKTEGIIPALESAHALGYLMTIAQDLPKSNAILVNLSGRGDKDLPSLLTKELHYVTHS